MNGSDDANVPRPWLRDDRAGLLAVLAAAAVLVGLHVLWMARFRWGYVTDWDEAGYSAIGLNDYDALSVGARAFYDAAWHSLGTQPPLVPLSAVPLLAVFGRDLDVAQLVVVPYFVGLMLASYGIARRLMPTRWATLAAVVVGTAPVVADYSRIFHFAVPAAALLTGGLWAGLRSDGLRRTGWVVVAALLLGLTPLARTMTIAYVPAAIVGLAIPALLIRESRGQRARNLALLIAIIVAVIAVWWVPNWDKVIDYLTGAGYGETSGQFGKSYSILSAEYWTKEARIVASYLLLPLAAVVLACFVAAATSLEVRSSGWRDRIRRGIASDAFPLAAVVAGGYLALSSTTNEGTAFALPWIPAMLILAVGAAASVRTGWLRTALATLLVGACVLNVLVKNGVSTTLSEPVSVSVPLVGIVQVLDGRDLLYSQLVGRGYPTPVPPSTLPAFQKGWGPFNERIARVVTRYAAQKREPPYVVVGTGDYFINDTRLDLAFELMNRRPLRVSLIAAGVDTEAAYRRQLSVFGNNFLLTSDAPRLGPPRIARATLEAAARASGFNPAASFRTPDGREPSCGGGERVERRVPRGSGSTPLGSRPRSDRLVTPGGGPSGRAPFSDSRVLEPVASSFTPPCRRRRVAPGR